MGLASKTYEDVFLESVTVDRPEFTAVTSDLAKLYARVDASTDDEIITLLISSAQKAFETYTQSPLYQSTVTAEFSASSGNIRFQVPLKPIVSITSVQQDGSDIDYKKQGNWLVIDGFNSEKGLITIEYTAGLYEDAESTVDPDIKEGLLKYIASNYDDRQDILGGTTLAKMPNDSKSKWKPFRYMRF